MNFKKYKDSFLVLPLGGCGEIGLNMTLYHYKGKWLMIDCGIGFADKSLMPGVDILIPDISFLHENNIKISSILITHAHEDHIGALTYLYEELGSPTIHASLFAKNVIEAKFASSRIEKYNIKTLKLDNESFNLQGFEIRTFNLYHSIPEMRAVLLKTPKGVVFHSGDWRMDDKKADCSDIKELQNIEDEVGVMLCDSTNVCVPESSPTETVLRDNLIKVVSKQKGLVVASIFSSNVSRIKSFYLAAKANKRKLAVSGNALHRIILAAQKSGYLKDVTFLDAKDAKGIPKSNLLLLATGCQAEPLASMKQLSTNNHRFFSLSSSDSVIFSSRAIPSNVDRISCMIDDLIKMGVKIINSDNEFVHISGHACKDELNEMYSIIKPFNAIPIHGDLFKLSEHGSLIKKHKDVNNFLLIKDGDVLDVNGRDVSVLGSVTVGCLGVKGLMLLSPDSSIMKIKRKISNEGIIICSSVINGGNKSIICPPSVSLPGIIDMRYHEDIKKEIEKKLLIRLKAFLPSLKNVKGKALKLKIDQELNATIKGVLKRNLQIFPLVEVITEII